MTFISHTANTFKAFCIFFFANLNIFSQLTIITGARCQVNENDCASMPCLNGGLCIDKVNGFYCNCTEEWMGTVCEVPYDVCQMRPCFNNGTCITGSNKHEFSCTCLPGKC